jgi:nucleoside-diphosphate-sugar epimerase
MPLAAEHCEILAIDRVSLDLRRREMTEAWISHARPHAVFLAAATVGGIYALAKIAGLKLCAAYRRQFGCDFISLQPTNLYGPGDNFHPDHSHVPAALIRRFHEAKIEGRPSVSV